MDTSTLAVTVVEMAPTPGKQVQLLKPELNVRATIMPLVADPHTLAIQLLALLVTVLSAALQSACETWG
jgi:hypothetical protein